MTFKKEEISGFFRELLLHMPHIHSVSELLEQVTASLSQWNPCILSRIWLADKCRSCPDCSVLPKCNKEHKCLELKTGWGGNSDFDVHLRKLLGQAAREKEAVTSYNIRKGSEWSFLGDWGKERGFVGFTAQPFIFKDSTLGMLGLLLNRKLDKAETDYVRLISDSVASAAVNARAFEEISRLKDRLKAENSYLRKEVSKALAYDELLGHSPSMRNIKRQIELVAPTDASVLILGESGTGKELVAREIHRRSLRCEKAIIKVNCPSIPKELYESEFFGHKKGSFTGADQDREGRFEAADGGSLFLDEVGEIPRELQSKLLRVLQEGQYERVGEESTRNVDVRIIAATNRPLEAEVAAGHFRQDLFYRLNVFPIQLVALRNRREDIPELAEHFLMKASAKFHREAPKLTRANMLTLQSYSWPGNVRELQNVMERAVITAQNKLLSFDLGHPIAENRATDIATDSPSEIFTEKQMKEMERENLKRALLSTEGKIYGPGGAAELLGLKPTTLISRMKKIKELPDNQNQ